MKLIDLMMGDYYIKANKKECISLCTTFIHNKIYFQTSYDTDNNDYSIHILGSYDDKQMVRKAILKKL